MATVLIVSRKIFQAYKQALNQQPLRSNQVKCYRVQNKHLFQRIVALKLETNYIVFRFLWYFGFEKSLLMENSNDYVEFLTVFFY